MTKLHESLFSEHALCYTPIICRIWSLLANPLIKPYCFRIPVVSVIFQQILFTFKFLVLDFNMNAKVFLKEQKQLDRNPENLDSDCNFTVSQNHKMGMAGRGHSGCAPISLL